MRVVALTGNPDNASAWWRITRPFAMLRRAGVDAQWCWLDDNDRPVLDVRGAVVVLHRVTPAGGKRKDVTRWVDGLRQLGATAIVYEADDDIWSPAYIEYLKAAGRCDALSEDRVRQETQRQVWAMQAADFVTVPNLELAEVAHDYSDAIVRVVPSAMDVPWYTDRLNRPKGGPLTIGWGGGRRPDTDLLPMAQAWGRIARRHSEVRFQVAGYPHDCIYREVEDDRRIDMIPWAELDEWPMTMQVDIGCAVVPDNAFSRCKSPIKAWEYGMAGAAVVGSSVLYDQCLANGENGAEATTVDEWEDSLDVLITRPDLRRMLRANLQDHVMRYHDLSKNLTAWANVYKEAAGVGSDLHGSGHIDSSSARVVPVAHMYDRGASHGGR